MNPENSCPKCNSLEVTKVQMYNKFTYYYESKLTTFKTRKSPRDADMHCRACEYDWKIKSKQMEKKQVC